eukprot:5873055-Alexandrium_andersonii.AAC.1
MGACRWRCLCSGQAAGWASPCRLPLTSKGNASVGLGWARAGRAGRARGSVASWDGLAWAARAQLVVGDLADGDPRFYDERVH